MDCFPFDADNNTNLQDNPVLNCTDSGMSDCNITIICYHFAFNFTGAAGVVGGLLSIIGSVFTVLRSVLIWFLDHSGKQDKCHRCYWCLKCIILFILAILPSVGTIVCTTKHSVGLFVMYLLDAGTFSHSMRIS